MKCIAIVTTQLVIAAAIVATGVLLLTSDVTAQRFALLGLGDTARMAVGLVEILAGLCLVLPRGQLAGVAMLALLATSVIGVTVGHLAAGGARSAARAPQIFSAVAGTCDRDPGSPLRLGAPRDWAI